jgi:hypothetical protein
MKNRLLIGCQFLRRTRLTVAEFSEVFEFRMGRGRFCFSVGPRTDTGPTGPRIARIPGQDRIEQLAQLIVRS